MNLLRCLGFWFLTLLTAAGPAWGSSDLAPFNGGGGIQVAEEGKPAKVFYPLEPGGYLDYAFAGPGRVWIYVRSGARPKGSWNYPLSMELPLEVVSTRIDGVPLTPAIDETGALKDSESTYPWLSKGILIDVPEGSTSFRLPSGLDAPPLLVRVMVPGTQSPPPSLSDNADSSPVEEPSEPPLAEADEEPALLDDLFYEDTDPNEEDPAEESSTETSLQGMEEDTPSADPSSEPQDGSDAGLSEDGGEDTVQPSILTGVEDALVDDADAVPEIIEAVPPEPVGEETFGGRYEIFDEEAQSLEDTAAREDLDEIEDLDDEATPEAVVLGSFSERLLHTLSAPRLTAGIGAGAPLQGTDAVASAVLGARVELLPVLTDSWKPGWGRLDLEISASWYRIGVRESLVVYDAIAGDSSIDIRYTTQVFPILFGLHYDIPVRLGPLLPFVGASGGFGVAYRGSEAPVTNLSGAWSGKLGVQIQTGPVSVLPQVSYTGMKAVLDRLSEEGCFANENLSTVRLDVAVQAQF